MQAKQRWIWVLLKTLAVLVILSHLYFEIALIIKLFIEPSLKTSGNLNYHEGLGLFAPVIYAFEGGIKILEGLSPILETIRVILFAINSLLLIISIIITRFVFKNKIWAGVAIALLSLPSWILWLGP